MRARMFRSIFKEVLKLGRKRQTIRPTPKRMPKVGDLESWRTWKGRPYWSGQEEQARVELTEVLPIEIAADGSMRLKGLNANVSTRYFIARADGFADYCEMLAHFRKHRSLPLKGVLIRGKDL